MLTESSVAIAPLRKARGCNGAKKRSCGGVVSRRNQCIAYKDDRTAVIVKEPAHIEPREGPEAREKAARVACCCESRVYAGSWLPVGDGHYTGILLVLLTYAVKYQCPTTPLTTTRMVPVAIAQLHSQTIMTNDASVPAQSFTCQTQTCASFGARVKYPIRSSRRARERKGIDPMKHAISRARDNKRMLG